MQKFPVIIDHKETQLDIENQALIIRTPDTDKQNIPLYIIDNLIIYGNPKLSARLLRQLAENNISTVLLPSRGKGQPAWVGASLAVNTQWRMHQYQCYQNPHCRQNLANQLMQQKLQAQNKTLTYLQEPPIDFTFHEISLPQLLGHEGQIAKQYFQTIANNLDPQWQFQGRNRRPPQDPYNSLLSLGYTLLVNEMNNAINANALDPWLGFYHETYPARPALALDLIEPLRPQIDLWSIMLLDQYFIPEDFTYSPSEGCRMTKSARQTYYQQWAEIRQQWQDTLNPKSLAQTCRQQVEDLKENLQNPRWQNIPDIFNEQAPF